MQLTNINGLLALLAIVPLIIIYLRRPKPTEKIFPSLMFILSEMDKDRKFRFFKKFMRNLLFFMQLLVIILLALTFAEPYTNVSFDISAKNTVVIVDASASMQAKLGSGTRFQKAIDEAKGYLTGKVSVVIAEDKPVVLLERGSKREALAALTAAKPKDTSTNIEAAMYEADALLGDEKGNIVVVSDFRTINELDQPLKARRILTAKDNAVKFVDVSNEAKNVGIIELEAGRKSTKAHIKNFNNEKALVNVKLIKDSSTIEQKDIEVLPKSVETAEFKTPAGVSRIEISSDDFSMDDIAYISSPEKEKVKVLLLTNAKSSFVMSAMQASPYIEIEIRKPPVVKAYELSHDVIVIDSVTEAIVPADIKDIKTYVEKGHAVIVNAQDSLKKNDLSQILPVAIGDAVMKTSAIKKDITNEFTKDIEINETKKYFKTSALNNTIVVASADGHPLIAYTTLNKGKFVYYGIFDDYSNFKTTLSYPLFWNNLINFLVETEDIRDYNQKIGNLNFAQYTKAGVYDIEGKKIAFNLLNEKESDISKSSDLKKEEEKFISKSTERSADVSLVIPLLIIAALLMIAEIIYVKYMGEL